PPWVVRVGSHKQWLSGHRPRPQFVESDGAQRLAREPEQDSVGQAEVAVLPLDLPRPLRGVADGEGGPPRVEQDDGRLLQQAYRLALPVGTVADAPGQEHGRQGAALILVQGLDVMQGVTSFLVLGYSTVHDEITTGQQSFGVAIPDADAIAGARP